MNEKRHLTKQLHEIEERIKQEEGLRYSELEQKLKTQHSHLQFLESELESSHKKNAQLRREFEGDLKRTSDEKVAMQEELGNLQQQGMRHALELNNLRVKLEEAKGLQGELDVAKKALEDTEKLRKELAMKNATIIKLREEIKIRDIELDSIDEENVLRVTEANIDERAADGD